MTVEKTCYFHCTQCGKIIEMRLENAPDLTQRIYDSRGAKIEGYDVYISGLCAECVARQKAGSQPD